MMTGWRSSAGGLRIAVVIALALLALLVILGVYYRPTQNSASFSPKSTSM